MPKPQLMRLLERLAELGCGRVQLSGGEPSLYPELPDVIRHIKALGMDCSLNSGGEGPHEAILAAIDAGLDELRISQDGPPEIDRLIRQRSQDSALMLLERVSSLESPPQLRVNAVLDRRTRPGVAWMAALARRLKLRLSLGLLRPGKGVDLGMMLSPKELRALLEELEGIEAEHGQQILCNFKVPGATSSLPYPLDGTCCPAGRASLGVDAQGRVSSCGYLGAMKQLGGSLFEIDLLKLWHEDPVFQATRETRRPDCQGCPHLGRGCNGGCMASALAESQDLDGPDPYCPWRSDHADPA